MSNNRQTEYDAAGAPQRRYVFDPTTGQPVIWYEGSGVLPANRRYLSQDERGSVISVSDSNGASLGINTYDEYGRPGSANLGLYQYTGQKWLGAAGLYDYKGRDYLPHLGIFAQTDPIGPVDDANLYAYALDDPVNFIDPLGLCAGGSVTYTPDKRGPSPTISCPRPILRVSPSGQTILQPRFTARQGGGSNAGPATPRRTQKPTQCQRAFLKDQLESRGLPTSQIDQLEFVSGLDSNANSVTRSVFPYAAAVTQGTTVYVQPSRFNEVANFRSPVGFEEAYHTGQFALYGSGTFYDSYGVMSAGAALLGLGGRGGNLIEQFAEGTSRAMYTNYQSSRCPR